MMPTGTRSPPGCPEHPVRAALDDAEVRAGLLRHAAARLGLWLSDRPARSRMDAAEEAVQEGMNRALARSASFDPAQSTAAAWLHGVLERVLHEQCRAIRKQPAQPAADPAAWNGLEARLAGEPAALAELLAVLPDDQRRLVTMFHLDEKSHEEIAAELGISVGNSRVRLARALAALRDHLAKGGGQ